MTYPTGKQQSENDYKKTNMFPIVRCLSLRAYTHCDMSDEHHWTEPKTGVTWSNFRKMS